MAHNSIEIEIQVGVENVKPLADFLQQRGAFQGEKRQVDEYFSPAHRDFTAVRPVKEWLRLRDSEGAFSINYKNWHYDDHGNNLSYCDEFETKVASAEQARKILMAMDCRPLVVVDKVRKTWHYGDYEIALDSVKGAGDFVEIEYIGHDDHADPQAVVRDMIAFLKKLGCGTITRDNVGYPFRLLFPDEIVNETL